MGRVLFENADVFDGVGDELLEGMSVLTDDNHIVEVSESAISGGADHRIDCTGRTLMPGMIDAHVHVYTADVAQLAGKPATFYSQYAGMFLRHMLGCGFTTVRDIAGGDHGLAMAIRRGFVEAPRYYYGGLALSQTGGHGDMRPPSQPSPPCTCGPELSLIAIMADGVDECVKAVREELRKGAHHIKIMASGGVMSPSDPIDRCQYSDAEITAIVDECRRQGAYVAAHCHPDEAIRRCVELGVRSIEHATLITPETAALLAAHDAFAVPTFAVMSALRETGASMGVARRSLDKLDTIYDQALEGLDVMARAGVRIGFGTDLLGDQHVRHGTEFTLRAQVQRPADILRSATSINARLLGEEDRLGRIQPGHLADLVVVNGDPLADIGLLASNGDDIDVIMRDGELVKA